MQLLCMQLVCSCCMNSCVWSFPHQLQVDDMLAQAQSVSRNLLEQRRIFGNVQDKLGVIGEKFPAISGLLNAIRRKKSKVWNRPLSSASCKQLWSLRVESLTSAQNCADFFRPSLCYANRQCAAQMQVLCAHLVGVGTETHTAVQMAPVLLATVLEPHLSYP